MSAACSFGSGDRNKLKRLGADDLTVQWFRSYLTGRTQVTDIGGTLSEPKGVTCGVPQGSILGPLLFLLYVNDMASAIRCKLFLYADDSALIAERKECGRYRINVKF